MTNNISRRDFLKLSYLLFLTQVLPLKQNFINYQSDPTKQNVLIIVFDALSARDIPFYGYQRDTTPNLTKLLEKATVFHNHYSAGNFTSPGTASLLTGTYPWTHRAYKKYGSVVKSVIDHNIFNAFDKEKFYRLAYSHNSYAVRILTQFEDFMEQHIPQQTLYLDKDWIVQIFGKDYDIATLSSIQILLSKEPTVLKNSLFLPDFYKKIISDKREKIQEAYADLFPRGLPSQWGDNYFLLEEGIDYLIQNLGKYPQPFLSYFHFYPPHYPYNPRKEFTELFKDDSYITIKKPEHIFSIGKDHKQILRYRLTYDQHIAYVDAEFARLFNFMENSGVLDNTWLILTSDHGEMFERGIIGHMTESLHEPVIKIPLIIYEPGQTSRQDIYTPTSSVDVLPTLLHLTGQSVPDWIEGEILPPYSNAAPDINRSIFSVDGRKNGIFEPLTKASIAMIKGQYKLHKYFGYDQLSPGETLYELYDLKNDPEELENLYFTKSSLARELQNEVQKKLDEVNEPYLGGD